MFANLLNQRKQQQQHRANSRILVHVWSNKKRKREREGGRERKQEAINCRSSRVCISLSCSTRTCCSCCWCCWLLTKQSNVSKLVHDNNNNKRNNNNGKKEKWPTGMPKMPKKLRENARDLFNCIRHSHSRSTTKWLPPPLAGGGSGGGDSGWWWCVLTISTDICPTPSAHPCPRGRIRWARCRWTAVSSACLFCGGWFACATRSGMGVGVGASRVVHIDWQRIKYTRRQQAAAGESEKENDEKRKIKKKLSQKPSWVSSGKFTAIIRQDIYIQI